MRYATPEEEHDQLDWIGGFSTETSKGMEAESPAFMLPLREATELSHGKQESGLFT